MSLTFVVMVLLVLQRRRAQAGQASSADQMEVDVTIRPDSRELREVRYNQGCCSWGTRDMPAPVLTQLDDAMVGRCRSWWMRYVRRRNCCVKGARGGRGDDGREEETVKVNAWC